MESSVASGEGRSSRAVFSLIVGAVFIDCFAIGLLTPFLPRLVSELAHGRTDASFITAMLLASNAACMFFASPVLGALSDQFGRRTVFLISIAGLALTNMFIATAQDLIVLMIVMPLEGVTSAIIASSYAAAADITPGQLRASRFGTLGAAMVGAFVLAPIIGGPLADINLRAPYALAATLGVLNLVIILLFLPETLAPDRRVRFSWFRANPVHAIGFLIQHQSLNAPALNYFVLQGMISLLPGMFALYAVDQFDWNGTTIGWLVAGAALTSMLAQAYLSNLLSRRFGERLTATIGIALGATGLCVVAFSLGPKTFILGVLICALQITAFPALQSIMSNEVDSNAQGMLQGANESVAGIARTAFPFLFGLIYANPLAAIMTTPGIAFAILGFITLTVLALANWLNQNLSRRRALKA